MSPRNSGSCGSGTGYRFKLFIAGGEPNSLKAWQTLKTLCERHLKGRYTLDVVDVLENFEAALEHGILVAPTLVRECPPPRGVMVGSLRDSGKVLEFLGVAEEQENQG